MEAYNLIKNFQLGAPAPVYHIVNQIDLLLRNNSWVCILGLVFAVRNKVARYATRLTMEVSERLYTLEHPVGGMEELIDWDLGPGIDLPDYVDVSIPNHAPDPVDFDGGFVLSDQVDELGLGQEDAPNAVVMEMEEDEQQLDPENLQEGIHHVDHGFNLFAADPPLGGVD